MRGGELFDRVTNVFDLSRTRLRLTMRCEKAAKSSMAYRWSITCSGCDRISLDPISASVCIPPHPHPHTYIAQKTKTCTPVDLLPDRLLPLVRLLPLPFAPRGRLLGRDGAEGVHKGLEAHADGVEVLQEEGLHLFVVVRI